MSSTFTGLQIGKSGLMSAMSNLQVTGNNISNVNTDGYTRQKVDTIALGAYNGSMRYVTCAANYKGLGSRITGTSQYRDASLDVRYRQEVAKLSQQTAAAEGLNEIGMIFDDTINTVMDEQFSNFVSQLQNFAGDPSSEVAENLVKTSAEVLTQFFNQYSDRIETAFGDMTATFNESIDNVNSILERVASLNDSIRNAQLGQYDALELRDERNVLLDELSQYMNIQVSTKSVPVGSGYSVETLKVDFLDKDGNVYNLIDGGDYNQLKATTNNGQFGIVLNDLNGTQIEDLTDNIYNGAFKGYLDILNGKGTYAGTNDNTYKGIPFYRESLNTLANKFATVLNEANGADKPMFEAEGGGVITAENIQLSEKWRTADGSYITNTVKTGGNYNTDNTNILYMISQLTGKQEFSTGNGTPFEGTFQDYLTNICATLGTQIQSNEILSTTYANNVDDIDYARESVSGVNLDEEAINMITYNYALTAASRFLTTVDEALNTLISSTGMVGR